MQQSPLLGRFCRLRWTTECGEIVHVQEVPPTAHTNPHLLLYVLHKNGSIERITDNNAYIMPAPAPAPPQTKSKDDVW